LTCAEYFRDEEGQDVLIFIDNIFRFTQAGSEVSALLGRMPSAVGYQPTLAVDLGGLQERITSTDQRLHYRGPVCLRACGRLDRPGSGHHLCPSGRHRGAVPSDCRAGYLPGGGSAGFHLAYPRPAYIGEEHYATARQVQQMLQKYKELQDIIAILGMEELSDEDKLTVSAGPQNPALPVPAVPRG
jgi:F-type H+-transporting ATPase subunit beta